MYRGPGVLGIGVGLVLGLQAAAAQPAPGRYAGVGLSFSQGESTAGSAESEGDLAALSLVLGNRWGGGPMSYAVELGADVNVAGTLSQGSSCGDDATDTYLCDPDATLRLRGLVGRPLGDAEVFGALGVGATFGTFATGPVSTGTGKVYGLSVGAGVSYPLRDGMRLRGEVTYDNFTNSDQPSDQVSDWNALSVRLMAVFNF